MIHKFRIGDRVRLREDSLYWGQSEGNVGVVFELRTSWDLPYAVRWARNNRNSYACRDLKYASVVYLEDHLKEKDIL